MCKCETCGCCCVKLLRVATEFTSVGTGAAAADVVVVIVFVGWFVDDVELAFVEVLVLPFSEFIDDISSFFVCLLL